MYICIYVYMYTWYGRTTVLLFCRNLPRGGRFFQTGVRRRKYAYMYIGTAGQRCSCFAGCPPMPRPLPLCTPSRSSSTLARGIHVCVGGGGRGGGVVSMGWAPWVLCLSLYLSLYLSLCLSLDVSVCVRVCLSSCVGLVCALSHTYTHTHTHPCARSLTHTNNTHSLNLKKKMGRGCVKE
jgi:hypothetical protein